MAALGQRYVDPRAAVDIFTGYCGNAALPVDSASFPESQFSELGRLTMSLRYMR